MIRKISVAILIAVLLVLVPTTVFAGWVDPTGNVANGWSDPTYAYDNDTGTNASYSVPASSWSPYLEMTIGSTTCDKVQVYCSGQTSDIDAIEVDVYYSGSYHNIYSGSFTQGTYEEYSIGGTEDVTAMQVRLYNSKSSTSRNAYIHDADFNDAAVTPDISNTPSSYDFGLVYESQTYTTGLSYFGVTNNSGAAVDITISAIDFTGGNGWTLSDTATPGSTTAGLLAGLSGDAYNIVVKKTPTYNTLVSNLADSATQDWGLELLAPTVFDDGVQKQTTVTLTATIH